jgi:hypothetical protein
MSNSKRRIGARTGVLTLALICVAAGALFVAGPASAASRGYTLTNKSDKTLKLVGASNMPATVCNGFICVETSHPMDFEGRPGDGSTIKPNANDRWELKYGFGQTYAAVLKYDVVGSDATVTYTIETTSYSNNSACKVTPPSAGKCNAGGLQMAFLGN